MRDVPWYRAWFYTINCLVLIFEVAFMLLTYSVFTQARIHYFPFDFTDFSVSLTFVTFAIQLIASLCGIVGIVLSSRNLVILFWILIILPLILDVGNAISWAIKFSDIHKHYHLFLKTTIAQDISALKITDAVDFCNIWHEINDELMCCPQWTVRAACKDFATWTSCHPKHATCETPLLLWLHSQMDPLAIILYFFLFPLKVVAVLVLREDIRELFAEFVYQRNPNIYTANWISNDSDDECETETLSSTPHSSKSNESGRLLLGKSKRDGEDIELAFDGQKPPSEAETQSPSPFP